jgi:hypothetical protein
MKEVIFLVEEAPEGGYTARALGISIYTEADDLPTLHEQIRDAVFCHFEEHERPRVV